MVWHQITYRTYVCQSQLFLLALLSALWPVETSSCLAPDDVSATEHSGSPVLRRGTVYCPTFVLRQHCLVSKIGLRLICFCSRILQLNYQLKSSSDVVWCPCRDFTDMLWHLTNCPIIILNYYYLIQVISEHAIRHSFVCQYVSASVSL